MLCCIRPRVNSSGDLKNKKKKGFAEEDEEKNVANVMNHTKCSSNSNGEKNKSEAIKTTQKPISKTFDNTINFDNSSEKVLKTKETAEKDLEIKEKLTGGEVNVNMGNRNAAPIRNEEVKPDCVDKKIVDSEMNNVAKTEDIIINTEIQNVAATKLEETKTLQNITTTKKSDIKSPNISIDENIKKNLPNNTSNTTTTTNHNTSTSTSNTATTIVAQTPTVTPHHIITVPDQSTTTCNVETTTTNNINAPTTSNIVEDKLKKTNLSNHSAETNITSTTPNKDVESNTASTDKKVEVFAKYVEKLENICLLIVEKFNNATPNDVSVSEETNKNNVTFNKEKTDVTGTSNETQPLYTIEDDVIHMTAISNNNELKVQGHASKLVVQNCFRMCANVECCIKNVVIEESKKVSVVVEGCTEVVIKDCEHVQVQTKTGLKKCTILNSNETIIFVDSETVKTCEFFNTKCCNFTIIVVSEEEKSLAHTVPDQVSSTFNDGDIKSVPFVFSF